MGNLGKLRLRRRPVASTALLVVMALLTAGCQWLSYGFDDANTRNNTVENRVSPTNVGALEELWRFDGAVGVTSTPALLGGRVFFGAWDGRLRALNSSTGALVWQTQLSAASLTASPLINGDNVYIGDSDGNMHAVDHATGAVQWSTTLDPHLDASIYSSAVAVDGMLIVGVASIELARLKPDYTFRGSIVALDLDTGAELWRTYVADNTPTSGAGASVWSSAALDRARGLLYIGTGQSYEAPASPTSDSLMALHYDTGEIEWHRQFTAGDVFTFWNMAGPDADIGAAPNLFTIEGRDVVGVGDKAGHYAVFDRDTGETVWTVELPEGNRLGGIMTTAAYADGTIYVSSNQWANVLDFHNPGNTSTTFALDAATGDIIWETDLPSPAFGAMTHANGVVYQTSVKGTVYALDASAGAVLWSDSPGADLGGGASIRGGTVFVGYGFWFIAAPANPVGGVVAYRLP